MCKKVGSIKMDESDKARGLLADKERQIKHIHSAITSVNRPNTVHRFQMILELGMSLMELEDHGSYADHNKATTGLPDNVQIDATHTPPQGGTGLEDTVDPNLGLGLGENLTAPSDPVDPEVEKRGL